jgi:hypothetical protein
MGNGHWAMGTLELKKRLYAGAGSNTILSMPYAPCPMPYASCPMPHAPCPMPIIAKFPHHRESLRLPNLYYTYRRRFVRYLLG